MAILPRSSGNISEIFLSKWTTRLPNLALAVLSQMDIAGGLMASEVAQGRAVTVTVDKMVFAMPVRVGQAICVHAELLRVGDSSMDIKLEVWARHLLGVYQAERQLVTEGVFRYVAVDDQGRPRRVPDNPQFFSRTDSAAT